MFPKSSLPRCAIARGGRIRVYQLAPAGAVDALNDFLGNATVLYDGPVRTRGAGPAGGREMEFSWDTPAPDTINDPVVILAAPDLPTIAPNSLTGHHIIELYVDPDAKFPGLRPDQAARLRRASAELFREAEKTPDLIARAMRGVSSQMVTELRRQLSPTRQDFLLLFLAQLDQALREFGDASFECAEWTTESSEKMDDLHTASQAARAAVVRLVVTQLLDMQAGRRTGFAEPSLTAAAGLLEERMRQQRAEGWTIDHDDAHTAGELALAAACYAFPPPRPAPLLRLWPWERSWWKPNAVNAADPLHAAGGPARGGDWIEARVQDLQKAGALILAEIERLNRRRSPLGRAAQPTQEKSTDGT